MGELTNRCDTMTAGVCTVIWRVVDEISRNVTEYRECENYFCARTKVPLTGGGGNGKRKDVTTYNENWGDTWKNPVGLRKPVC